MHSNSLSVVNFSRPIVKVEQDEFETINPEVGECVIAAVEKCRDEAASLMSVDKRV